MTQSTTKGTYTPTPASSSPRLQSNGHQEGAPLEEQLFVYSNTLYEYTQRFAIGPLIRLAQFCHAVSYSFAI